MTQINKASLPQYTEREYMTLYQIVRALNSTLGLKETVETIIEAVIQATGAERGCLLLVDEKSGELNFEVGCNIELSTMDDSSFHISRTVISRVRDSAQPVLTINAQEDPEFSLQSSVIRYSLRSILCVPLLSFGKVIGVIYLDNRVRAGQFSERDLSLLTAAADQIVVALERARICEMERAKRQEADTLRNITTLIASTLDLEQVLTRILKEVKDTLGVEDSSILLVDERTGELFFAATTNDRAGLLKSLRLLPGQGIAGWGVQTGQPLLVPDVRKDPRFQQLLETYDILDTRSVLCIPLKVRDRVIGVVEAVNKIEGDFTARDMALLDSLAVPMAIAIENARLFGQVKESQARYIRLFEDSTNPIWITDLEGKILEVNRNACDLLGYSVEELSERTIFEIHREPVLREKMPELLEGKDMRFETWLLTKEGADVPVELSVRKISHKGQEFFQIIGRDITERKEFEARREDLIHMIVHDLRSPLGSILSSLEMIKMLEEEEDREIYDQLLKIATDSGNKMMKLVDSLLEIYYLESGQMHLFKKEVSLESLIESTVEQFAPQLLRDEVSLHVDLPRPLTKVEADEEIISRVLTNLLDNALRFTSPGGRIEITVREHEELAEAAVSITDHGPGIPPEQQKLIFEKFGRVREHQERHKGGLGLGLAFCKLAVEAHGGRIWVESQPGQGSTFTFTLRPAKPQWEKSTIDNKAN